MRRDKIEIIAAILRTCESEDGVNKTKIVYQANLNFRTVNPYLDLLVKRGLIDVERHGGTLYKLNDKGMGVLESFETIERTLSG